MHLSRMKLNKRLMIIFQHGSPSIIKTIGMELISQPLSIYIIFLREFWAQYSAKHRTYLSNGSDICCEVFILVR